MNNEPIPREAKLLIQLGEIQSQLWRARDRAWKLGRERNRLKEAVKNAEVQRDTYLEAYSNLQLNLIGL